MEEQGHSRDGEAGPPAVEMVVLTGVYERVSSTSNSLSPCAADDSITLVASVILALFFSPIIFLFAFLSVILDNMFLSKEVERRREEGSWFCWRASPARER